MKLKMYRDNFFLQGPIKSMIPEKNAENSEADFKSLINLAMANKVS